MTMPEIRTDDELELTDYLRILRRRWMWVVAAASIVLIIAITLSVVQDASYSASAKVSLGDSAAQEAVRGGGLANGPAASRELSNEVNLALSDTVRADVVAELGAEPDIAIEPEDESDALHFTATAPTADEAALGANTWAQIYVDTKRRQASDSIATTVEAFETDLDDLRLQRQETRAPLDELEVRLASAASEEELASLQAQLTRTEADLRTDLDVIDARIAAVAQSITDLEVSSRLASTGTASVVQVAAPPRQPTNASLARNLILATIVGLILGAAAALLVENLDRTIKTSDDITSLGLPVLGEIPVPGRHLTEAELPLATMRHTGTPVAESYQKIRTSVEFALLGRRINSLLITSPNQSEGKTTLATNLAWAMSAVDHRVALVDVDFRRPRLHQIFECPQVPGLSDHLLSGTALIDLALRLDQYGSRNLIVLPSGRTPPSPADFVASPAFATLIRDIETEADLVILDAPPVLPVSDATSIGRQVDAVIVVAMAGETTRDRLVETIDALRQVGGDVIGVCLVGVRQSSTRYGYYTHDPRGGRGPLRRRRPDRDIDLRPVRANGTSPEGTAVDGPIGLNGSSPGHLRVTPPRSR